MTTIPNDNLRIAENYYNAMLSKNFELMESFLNDDVHLISPLSEIHGKKAVVIAAKNFGEILQDIEIRSRFASNNQIMFAYDMTAPKPIGKFRAAVLMEFSNYLISKIELFYDARPFEEKRTEIFGDGRKN